MELEDRLIEFRNTRNKAEFSEYFRSHPEKIDELVQLIVELRPYPVKEYGSWILCHLVKNDPKNFQRYYSTFIDLLFRTRDQSVLRNIMVCLIHLRVEPHREGELVTQLLRFIEEGSNKVALQVYSIYMLKNIGSKHPDLIPEFRQTIDFHARNKTAAYWVAQRNFNRAFPKK